MLSLASNTRRDFVAKYSSDNGTVFEKTRTGGGLNFFEKLHV